VSKRQEHLWDGKKEIRIGRSLGEAAAEWAKRVHRMEQDDCGLRPSLQEIKYSRRGNRYGNN
jgi:hypothetical protein